MHPAFDGLSRSSKEHGNTELAEIGGAVLAEILIERELFMLENFWFLEKLVIPNRCKEKVLAKCPKFFQKMMGVYTKTLGTFY